LTFTLIPQNIADNDDPLTWEEPCDDGAYNHYAIQLADTLVAAGFQYAVIRLGVEPTGPWEFDFVGTTLKEQHDWARCFAQEVRSMRSAAGAHFLFDWNVNACYEDIPFADYYPGDTYVDIIGIDFYDISCSTTLPGAVPASWADLEREPNGLNAFAAFARRTREPISIPEWGLETKPNGDDPYYIKGIANFVRTHDVSFESYFDAGDEGILSLGPADPISLTAYHLEFSS
jgi:hypothetical protein